MKIRKIAKSAGALGLAAAMTSGMPVMAAFTYTPVAGTSTTFKKYLIVPAGTKAPNVTFNYTIAAGTARSTETVGDANNQVMQVLPGVHPELITISSTTFAPSDTLSSAAAADDIDVKRQDRTKVKFETAKNEQFAVQTSTIDFSAVSFDEPGIYRYIVTETASAADEAYGIKHDDDVERILDVYVTNSPDTATDKTLVVAGYVLHIGRDGQPTGEDDIAIGANMGSADVAAQLAALADKTNGFTNEYQPKDLIFKKEVAGNQASRDKVFEFTLNITDAHEGDKFVVSLADDNNANTSDGDADATSASNSATIAANAGKTNVTELTVGAGGTLTQKFYLQHGQSIAVRGLPLNASYTVTEEKEDYKSEASAVTGHTDATTGVVGTIAGENQAIKTSFKNTRDGIIPTGVFMTVAPFAVVTLIGGFGAAKIGMKKRDEE